jgi:hypothetical protein
MRIIFVCFLLLFSTWARGQKDTILNEKQMKALTGLWYGCRYFEPYKDGNWEGVRHLTGCKIIIDQNFTFTWTKLDSLRTETTGKWKVVAKFKKRSDCGFQLKLDTKEGDFGYFLLCGPSLNNLFYVNQLSPDSSRYTINFMKAK